MMDMYRLLLADARGVFSYVFVDFGNEFRVDDPNGEAPKEVCSLLSFVWSLIDCLAVPH